MLSCIECRHCSACETADGHRKTCGNPLSPRYNQVMTEDMAGRISCDMQETQQAYDYRHLTPWEFANKYYN